MYFFHCIKNNKNKIAMKENFVFLFSSYDDSFDRVTLYTV